MIKLKIGQTKLKFDIIFNNVSSIKRNKLNCRNELAILIKLNPDNKIVDLLFDVVDRNVEVLKTNDIFLLSLSKLMFDRFNLRIIKCD